MAINYDKLKHLYDRKGYEFGYGNIEDVSMYYISEIETMLLIDTKRDKILKANLIMRHIPFMDALELNEKQIYQLRYTLSALGITNDLLEK